MRSPHQTPQSDYNVCRAGEYSLPFPYSGGGVNNSLFPLKLALDVLVFALTCWNAFDRPRHLQAAITKQLITDGVIYFVVSDA
jgi:hypothetical protein